MPLLTFNNSKFLFLLTTNNFYQTVNNFPTRECELWKKYQKLIKY